MFKSFGAGLAATRRGRRPARRGRRWQPRPQAPCPRCRNPARGPSMSAEGERYRATYRFGTLERRGVAGRAPAGPGRPAGRRLRCSPSRSSGACRPPAASRWRRRRDRGGVPRDLAPRRRVARSTSGRRWWSSWLVLRGRSAASRHRSAASRARARPSTSTPAELRRPLDLPQPLDRLELLALPLPTTASSACSPIAATARTRRSPSCGSGRSGCSPRPSRSGGSSAGAASSRRWPATADRCAGSR